MDYAKLNNADLLDEGRRYINRGTARIAEYQRRVGAGIDHQPEPEPVTDEPPAEPEEPDVPEEPAPEAEPQPERKFDEAPIIGMAGSHAHVGDQLEARHGSVLGASLYTYAWLCDDKVLGQEATFVATHACHVSLEVTAHGDSWTLAAETDPLTVGEAHHPAPAPTPTPAPAPSGHIFGTLSPEFDVSEEVLAKYAEFKYSAMKHDMESKWRWGGSPTLELVYDDPMVFPGQPGRSHLHSPYGMFGFNANMTVEDLLANDGPNTWVVGPLSRSIGWHPTGLTHDDQVKHGEVMRFYYENRYPEQRYPALPEGYNTRSLYDASNRIAEEQGIDKAAARDIVWSAAEKEYHDEQGTKFDTIFTPNGLNHLGGHQMDGSPGNAKFKLAIPKDSGGRVYYEAPTVTDCVARWYADGGSGDSPAGSQLTAIVSFGRGWNGQLTSNDFRSHLSGLAGGNITGYRNNLAKATHPFIVPGITAFVDWDQRTGEPPVSLMRFVSDMDEVKGSNANDVDGRKRGDTFHIDYFPMHSNILRHQVYDKLIVPHHATSWSGSGMRVSPELVTRNELFQPNGPPRRFDQIPDRPALTGHSGHMRH